MSICSFAKKCISGAMACLMAVTGALFAAPAVAHGEEHYVPSELASAFTPSTITPRGTTPWGDPCFDGIAYVNNLEEAYQYGTIKMLELDPDKMVVEHINTDVLTKKNGTWSNQNISDYTFTTLIVKRRNTPVYRHGDIRRS